MSPDEINTIDEFREACVRHDLTHAYSDDGSVYRSGAADHSRLVKAAAKFPRADVERVWNEIVDTKLVESARSQFYWRWPTQPDSAPAVAPAPASPETSSPPSRGGHS